MMGGAITVESSPGHSSVFRVSLPADVAESASVVPTARDAPRVIGLAPGQLRFRILVVEDQEENRKLLTELLKRAGLQVKSVADGAAAVRAFRSWQPHFIWMDWLLPVMDGEQATKAIRGRDAGGRVKIAAVTATVFTEERAALLAAGVDDLVRKPFQPHEVFECMARLLAVRYIYEEHRTPDQVSSDAVLAPEVLRVLPESLRQELGDAVISLDVSRVTGAIRRASELDREIGSACHGMPSRSVSRRS
jgi:CheY-like chemotaxis protein